MRRDHLDYLPFTKRSRLDKSINSLLGIVEGIAVDSAINGSEVDFLNLWLGEHRDLRKQHPYNELLPVVQNAIDDGVLSADERDDILWLCEKLRSTAFFDEVTADVQRLHAVLGGIAADSCISEAELQGLSDWLERHSHLRRRWPFDEVESLIVSVMQDKKVDDHEHHVLHTFFSEFVSILDSRTIVRPGVSVDGNIMGLVATCPEIEFAERTFCFTGASHTYSRSDFSKLIEKLGGTIRKGVSDKLDYLVVGAEGNPCWTYACYGRKVEQAVNARRAGSRLLIVHENDVHDALEDHSAVRRT
jgi:BRCA1 C Terminus (BRCT) domain